MRILIVSDAWRPQVNGVVRTLEALGTGLAAAGHSVEFIGPDRFPNAPCPTYPDIRLALVTARTLAIEVDAFFPDAVHIATEGPLGHAMKGLCAKRGWSFTTAFHTRFPEYIETRFGLPARWTMKLMRRFHAASSGVMVATPTLERELASHGFDNLVRLGRGVDTGLFQPGDKTWLKLPRPVFLYVGRVSVEKNLEAFLALDLPGSKLVVGDGPARAALEKRFTAAVFAGAKRGRELARHYQAADCFVFPSKTDTFGLVMLEALACGVPVAAFPVPGPVDVVTSPEVGVLSEDLADAAWRALGCDPAACRAFALRHGWDAVTRQFLGNLKRKTWVGTLARKSLSTAVHNVLAPS